MKQELKNHLSAEITQTEDLIAKMLERFEQVTGLKVYDIRVKRFATVDDITTPPKYTASLVLHQTL